MRQEEFARKDGTVGFNYYPEKGDEFKANAEKVFSKEYAANVKGKALILKSYGLSVITKDNKEIFLKITEGQAKVLNKVTELKGKTIVFENYEHEEHGTLLGARIKED